MGGIRLVLAAVIFTQLMGCMTTLKVLSAIGEGAKGQQPYVVPVTPSYEPPAVYQPTLNNPTSRYYCWISGGVTQCKEL